MATFSRLKAQQKREAKGKKKEEVTKAFQATIDYLFTASKGEEVSSEQLLESFISFAHRRADIAGVRLSDVHVPGMPASSTSGDSSAPIPDGGGASTSTATRMP